LQNQLHDFNPGIAPNGLFWTIPIPDEALEIRGHQAHLHLNRVRVEDNFTFLGPGHVPAWVSLDVKWVQSTAPARHLKPGSDDPMDPTRVEALFHDATATGYFSVDAPAENFHLVRAFGSSQGIFAEMGYEKNGAFLRHGHRDDDDDDALAKAVDDDGLSHDAIDLAHGLALRAAPNPSVTGTTLEYAIDRAAPVTVAIYDLAGRRVALLAERSSVEAGAHTVFWDLRDTSGRRVPPGAYLARMQSGSRQSTTRVLVEP
jgi:hypothetical protein